MSKRSDVTRVNPLKRPAQRLDQMVAPIARPVLKKYGFHELHIFEHWGDIVGHDVAQDCIPLKLSRRRGRETGATLTIRVAGYRSLEIQHSLRQIQDRLNSYLGGAVIDRIKLVQGPIPRDFRGLSDMPAPLSKRENQSIVEAASSIENDQLRHTIERLGQGVRRRSKSHKRHR